VYERICARTFSRAITREPTSRGDLARLHELPVDAHPGLHPSAHRLEVHVGGAVARGLHAQKLRDHRRLRRHAVTELLERAGYLLERGAAPERLVLPRPGALKLALNAVLRPEHLRTRGAGDRPRVARAPEGQRQPPAPRVGLHGLDLRPLRGVRAPLVGDAHRDQRDAVGRDVQLDAPSAKHLRVARDAARSLLLRHLLHDGASTSRTTFCVTVGRGHPSPVTCSKAR
jgi:hypothetical protein